MLSSCSLLSVLVVWVVVTAFLFHCEFDVQTRFCNLWDKKYALFVQNYERSWANKNHFSSFGSVIFMILWCLRYLIFMLLILLQYITNIIQFQLCNSVSDISVCVEAIQFEKCCPFQRNKRTQIRINLFVDGWRMYSVYTVEFTQMMGSQTNSNKFMIFLIWISYFISGYFPNQIQSNSNKKKEKKTFSFHIYTIHIHFD